MAKRPVMLIILDGFGLRKRLPGGNAIKLAKTPI